MIAASARNRFVMSLFSPRTPSGRALTFIRPSVKGLRVEKTPIPPPWLRRVLKDSTGSNATLIFRSMSDMGEVAGFVVEVAGEAVVELCTDPFVGRKRKRGGWLSAVLAVFAVVAVVIVLAVWWYG